MLFKEGMDFAARLGPLKKNVKTTIIEQKRHAFDKCPNPFKVDPKVAVHYGEACKLLKDAFNSE